MYCVYFWFLSLFFDIFDHFSMISGFFLSNMIERTCWEVWFWKKVMEIITIFGFFFEFFNFFFQFLVNFDQKFSCSPVIISCFYHFFAIFFTIFLWFSDFFCQIWSNERVERCIFHFLLVLKKKWWKLSQFLDFF